MTIAHTATRHTATRHTATDAGTTRYRDRFAHLPAAHFRQRYGLWLSSLGIGTYLGADDAATDAAYVAALQAALRAGCNVIDTAINYRGMASERAVGRALGELFDAGEFQRDEVLVCTKGGYLTHTSSARLVAAGLATAAEIVDDAHCLAPDFLSDQITTSLGNLGLAALDVYYLHNPETQLARIPPDEFMARLRAAFTRLEAEADAGRIRFYGVATWQGLRAEEHDRQYLPLFLLARLAQEVGGAQHRCRFVQLPYNLTMPEAFFTRNQVMERAADDGATQRQSVPLLAAAVQHGIAAMTSASLRQTQVLGRVPASVKQVLGPELSEAQVALHFARSTPGVTTALVGMRQVEHVAENLAVAALPPLPATDFLKRFTRRG